MSNEVRVNRALRAIDEFRREVAETAPGEVDLRELERELQMRLNQVGRELMKEVLAHADVRSPTITVQGESWGNRRESEGTYSTLFGTVEVLRSTYQRGGGGKVFVRLERRLGIVEKRYTPQVARVLTRAVALMTAEEAEGFLAETGVATVSKSTLHRIPHATAARYEQRRKEINDELRESEEVPDAAVRVRYPWTGSWSLKMANTLCRGGARRIHPERLAMSNGTVASLNSAPSLEDGASGRAWHEACVGTLSYWDADGEHLKTVYVARMPESGKGTVADELEDELHAALGERPDLHVCFAADGNPIQWELLEGISVRTPSEASAHSYLLDFYHCAGYLESGANAVHCEDAAAARVLARHWGDILREHDDGQTASSKQCGIIATNCLSATGVAPWRPRSASSPTKLDAAVLLTPKRCVTIVPSAVAASKQPPRPLWACASNAPAPASRNTVGKRSCSFERPFSRTALPASPPPLNGPT